MSPLDFNNCLNPSWNVFYKSLACFWSNLVLLFCHSLPQFMNSLWWCWIFPQPLLQVHPWVFNWVKVWGLGRPWKYLNIIVFKQLGCLFWGMFGIIILLKDPFLFLHLQLLKAVHHSIFRNFTVLHCIHLSLNLSELSYPMHPHTMRLFPPPCLTVGVVVLLESGVPFSFQVYTLPSDPIFLIFVSSDYRTLFQSSTVQFSCFWANLGWFCWWACLSSGCFCLTTEQKFLSLSAFLTVFGVTGEGRMSLIKWTASTALSSFPVVIWQIIDCVSWEERLEGQPPLLFSLSKSVFFLILPTVNLPKPV